MAKTRALTAPAENDWRREVSFDFGGGSLKEPEAFKTLDLDDEVTVTLKGKITNLRKGSDGDGKQTSSFTLRMESVEVENHDPEDTKNMGSMLTKIGKSRKV